MKYTPIEIAGMLQDNQSTIYKLKQEIVKLNEIINQRKEEELDIFNDIDDGSWIGR